MALLPRKTKNGLKAEMTKFVLDAYAWIEYLEGSDKGKKVAKIIEDDSNNIFTSSATVAEVVSKVLRSGKDVNTALAHINGFSKVLDVIQEISVSAGQTHFEAKKKNQNFGMLDAFVAATANHLNAKILTGDDDFKHFKTAVFI